VNYDSRTDAPAVNVAPHGCNEGRRRIDKLPRFRSRAPERLAPVHALLRYAAASPGAQVDPVPTAAWDDRQLSHVLKAGLAPLLWRWARSTAATLPASWSKALQAADLTAQVVYGNLRDAAIDVVDACRDAGVRVTLLKGTSIGDEYYPAAHLRIMGDVDVLVAERDGTRIRRILQRRGYAPMAGFDEKEDFHGAPLFEPELRVWVEIHTGLFNEADRLRRNRLFAPSRLERRIVASTFAGRPVGRLSPELQLVYIASYWWRDASSHGLHASFARPLLDAVYLLAGAELDWDRLLADLDNETAAASLYLLLSFLSARELCAVPEHVLERLASAQSFVGTVELAILDAIIDRSLLDGRPLLGAFGERHPMVVETLLRALLGAGSPAGKLLSLPWGLVFPPWIAERYTLAYHRDRLRRLLAGRR